VAGFYSLQGLDDEGGVIVRPWLETPIASKNVQSHVREIRAIFSDNDPWVPIENEQFFKERLGATTVMLHDRGHFSDSDHTTELPEVLETVLALVA